MKTSFLIYFSFFIFLFFSNRLYAQCSGSSFSTAISLNSTANTCGDWSSARSAEVGLESCFLNSYGLEQKDVYYKFTLSEQSVVVLSGNGDDEYTPIFHHLLNQTGILIEEKQISNSGLSSSVKNALTRTLAAGTYYVVSEGAVSGMNQLYMSIKVLPTSTIPLGATSYNPIDVGTLSCNNVLAFTDTKSINCMLDDEYGNGYNLADIYYKFTLTNTMELKFSNCVPNANGSFANTYLNLLDATGSAIAYKNFYQRTCTESYLWKTLPPGTYYLVSEVYGWSNVTTAIATTQHVPLLGATKDNPIEIGHLGGNCGKQYSSSHQIGPNSCFGHEYGPPTDDIFYRFTLDNAASVNSFSYYTDNNNSDNGYATILKSDGVTPVLGNELEAGTYYMVVEAAAEKIGEINCDLIVGPNLARPGVSIANAINAGVLGCSSRFFTDSQVSVCNSLEDIDEIFYTFSLPQSGNVKFSNCNANGDFLSYLSLLDAEGNTLDSQMFENVQCQDEEHVSLTIWLEAGTYYVHTNVVYSYSPDISTEISVEDASAPLVVSISPGNQTICEFEGVNFTATSPGKSSGLAFDGFDDYLRIYEAHELKMENQLTLEAWVYAESISYRQIKPIVSKEGEYAIALSGNNSLMWAFANSNSTMPWTYSELVLPSTAWSHIAVSYEAGVVKIYLNGELKETHQGSGSIGDMDPEHNDLWIGGEEKSNFFHGKIDEVRIWNTVRTQTEIFNYKDIASINTNETGLIACFHLDEGKGVIAKDATYRKFMAILTANPTWIMDTPLMLYPSYTWVSSDGTFSKVGNIISPTPQQTTTYTVTALAPNGCSAQASVTVTVLHEKATITIASKQVVSADGSIETQLTASGADTYSWSPSAGLNTTSGAVVLANPSVATEYTVVGQKSGFCKGSSSVTVSGTNLNYVITNTILTDKKEDGTLITASDIPGLPVEHRAQSTTYYDGLGRPIQTVVKQGSPSKKDFVQPLAYDQNGNESFKYLPYTAGNDGFYKPNALNASSNPIADPSAYANTEQYKFYQEATGPAGIAYDAKPFNQSIFEASPLNRVLEKGSFGSTWQPSDQSGSSAGFTVKQIQRTNLTDEVRLWKYQVDQNQQIQIISTGYYSLVSDPANPNELIGELLVSETTNEEGRKLLEYKNKEGKVVCKKAQKQKNGISYLETHYIYDISGQLRMVIQPEGVNHLTQVLSNQVYTITADGAFAKRWCYLYQYDNWSRMIEKRTPGAEPIYMIYNKADLVMLTQDGNQRLDAKWNFTKYDVFGRIVQTGLYTNTDRTSRVDLQADADKVPYLFEQRATEDSDNPKGYTNQAFPNLTTTVSTPWKPALGEHQLSATATDAGGGSGEPLQLHFSVINPSENQAPKITLSTPAIIFPFAPTIELNATASDDGSLASVSFFQGNTQLATVSTAPYRFTWTSALPGPYILTAKATDTQGRSTFSKPVSITVAAAASVATGSILWEKWANFAGDLLIKLPFHTQPTTSAQLTLLEGPANLEESYGSRIRGYVHPPITGTYTFWIAADDQAELWLSSDEDPVHKVRIARVDEATNLRDWVKSPLQKSAPISLVAGRRYYLEALHKEGTSSDHLSVGWQLPNNSLERPIPGNRLSTFEPGLRVAPKVVLTTPANAATFAYQAATQTTPAGGVVLLEATAWDLYGSIQKVEFYDGTSFIGSDATAPYQFEWTGVSAGVHQVLAIATDNQGVTSSTAPVSMLVSHSLQNSLEAEGGNDPVQGSVELTNVRVNNNKAGYLGTGFLDNFATVTTSTAVGSDVTFTVRISQAGSYQVALRYANGRTATQKLSLYVNGSKVKQLQFAGTLYWTTWSTLTETVTLLAGENKISYRYDAGDNGNVNLDGIRVFSNAENVAPAAAITLPVEGAAYQQGSPLTLQADAFDFDGSVAKVAFFWEGSSTPLGTSTVAPFEVVWESAPLGNHLITAMATDNSGATYTTSGVSIHVGSGLPTQLIATGNVLREVWTGITGTSIASVPLTTTPNSRNYPTSFQTPQNLGDNYGTRLRAFLLPPVTGFYQLAVTGAEKAELWLKTSPEDADKQRVAYNTVRISAGNYTTQTTQKTGSIWLEAGKRYYLEALHKEGTGNNDHVSVGWQTPAMGTSLSFVTIPGSALSAFIPSDGIPTAIAGEDQTVVLSSNNLILHGQGRDNDGRIVSYQWQKVSGPAVTLGGQTSADLTLSGLAVGSYDFSLVVTDENGNSSSADQVLLTVESPKPSIVAFQLLGANGNLIRTLQEGEQLTETEVAGGANIQAVVHPDPVASVSFLYDTDAAVTRTNSPYRYQTASSEIRTVGELLIVNYYDDYEFAAYANDLKAGQPRKQYQIPESGYETKRFNRTMGKATGSLIRVLNAEPYQWLVGVTFYDKYGRVIQTHSDNHLGGTDVASSQYDFTGKVIQTFVRHKNPKDKDRSMLIIKQASTYDHAGRVLSTLQRIDETVDERSIWNTGEPISSNHYNELGLLINKAVGTQRNSITPLQQMDFRYNIRGWLSNINDITQTLGSGATQRMFAMELHYTTGPYALHNGSISAMHWKSSLDNTKRSYSYQYDGLNRLIQADYSSKDKNGEVTPERFSLTGVSYDDNGNIKTLNQQGLVSLDEGKPAFGSIDQLKYTYQSDGNQLESVQDKETTSGLGGDFQDGNNADLDSEEYVYDANGNLTKDKNKGISSIRYNYLNMPEIIVFKGEDNRRIEYVYLAGGVKLSKRVYQGINKVEVTDYLGGIVYEENNLQFVPTGGGRALPPKLSGEDNFAYEYHYKDHLGNLRLSFRQPKNTNQEFTTSLDCNKENGFDNVLETRVDIRKTGESCASADQRSDRNFAYMDYYSSRLNARENRPMGPLRLIPVRKGEKFTAQAQALFIDKPNDSFRFNLVPFITNTYGTPGTDGHRKLQNLSVGFYLVSNSKYRTDKSLPNAYLKYTLLDKEGNPVKGANGEQYVSSTQHNAWGKLLIEEQTIENDGYLQVYVANESDVNVWFDDISITITPQMIVQENHYSPFGSNLAGIEKLGNPDHKFQFNGKEKQEELDLNWIDYGARNYDPQLGRWQNIDPLTEKYLDISPFIYTLNNPTNAIDPDGKRVYLVVSETKTVFGEDSDGIPFSKQVTTNQFLVFDVTALAPQLTGNDKILYAYYNKARELPGIGDELRKYEQSTTDDVYIFWDTNPNTQNIVSKKHLGNQVAATEFDVKDENGDGVFQLAEILGRAKDTEDEIIKRDDFEKLDGKLTYKNLDARNHLISYTNIFLENRMMEEYSTTGIMYSSSDRAMFNAMYHEIKNHISDAIIGLDIDFQHLHYYKTLYYNARYPVPGSDHEKADSIILDFLKIKR